MDFPSQAAHAGDGDHEDDQVQGSGDDEVDLSVGELSGYGVSPRPSIDGTEYRLKNRQCR